MSKEAILRSRVSVELKDKFEAKAKAVGMSPSDLVRVLATQATKDITANPGSEEVEKAPKKIGQVWFRLSQDEHATLRNLGKSYGMTYNQYAALLIKAKLSGASIPTNAEMRALEEANYELMAIGRNLNQISHALNLQIKLHGSIGKSDAEKVRTSLLSELKEYVERQQQQVESLLDAMQRRAT